MLIDTTRDASIPHQVVDGNQSPIDPDAAPTWRLYDGNMGLVASGTLAQAISGSITGATNVDPSIITSAAHGLATGTRVKIASVGGAVGVNGSFTVTRINTSTFSVDTSGAPGVYTSGGTWHVLGLYKWEINSSIRSQLEPGRVYTLMIDYLVSSVQKSETLYMNAA